MTGSTVTAYAVNSSDGANGTLLDTTRTGTNGAFTLKIAAQLGPVRITASGGSYISEMNGASIDAPGAVSVLLASAKANTSGISLNPVSTFVDRRTVGILVRGGTTFSLALSEATTRIEQIYGLTNNPGSLIPSYDTTGTNQANLGLILGAIINEDRYLCPGSPGSLVTALAADISDGVFDGMAAGAPVRYCGSNLPAIAGTTDFQDALLGVAQLQRVTEAFILGGTGNILTTNGLANLALDGTTVYPIAPLATINQAIVKAAPAPVNRFAPVNQTARMIDLRYDAAAVGLANGKFLIAGGISGNTFLASTELYNPLTNSFLNPNPATMTTTRANETATLLPNGKVLIAGGAKTETVWTNTTDLYNPTNNTIVAGPSMNDAREGATATLLPNGKVLIAGGRNTFFLRSTELYDPATNTFMIPDHTVLTIAREDASAALLPNGKVLIAGGRDGSGSPLASTELYDPANNSIAPGPVMSVARTYARATLLPNGKVLIAGGLGYGSTVLKSTELYNPATNNFLIPDPATMNVARYFTTNTLLSNGKVLIAGGYGGVGDDTLGSTELYEPSSNRFLTSGTATMTASRGLASAALLPNGKVIIAGGVSSNGSAVVNTTDLYTP